MTEQNNVQMVLRINPEQYREISSFDDALRLAHEQYGSIEAAGSALGDGFELLPTEQKSQLVGVPMLLISFEFLLSNVGEQGLFVSVHAITKDGRKVIFNDGSTGIYKQLKDYQETTGRSGGLLVQHGLRKSEYIYTDGSGKERPAVTYYLDTAS